MSQTMPPNERERLTFVGAMKIARNVPVSERHVEWYPPPQPFPAPSLRELSRPTGVTEGVSSDEWYSVKSSEFRRGDENRPYPHGLASTRLNGNISRLPL